VRRFIVRGTVSRLRHLLVLPLIVCSILIGLASRVAAQNPAPTLSSILPNTAAVGSGAFTLTATGSSFVASSVVRWNGSSRTTTFVSSTQLQAQILASDIAATGSASVTVFTPTPGGGTSAAKTFSITSTNPSPTLSFIAPTSATAGGSAFTLTLNSNNNTFAITSVVRWNGSSRTTTFVNHGQLTAQISAADIASAGTASVTVFTPTPGGGTSSAKTFTVNNPAPTLSSILPSTAAVGSGAFTLTVTGSNYNASSVVRWKGSNRTTTFISSTQLQAAIPASDITATGTAAVTVFNPTPGGGTSGSVTFTITATNPVPALSSISPTSAGAGGAAFTLTATGTNFAITSVVRWNGSNRTTTFVSHTQLTAQISAADIATAGTVPVTVFTPTPGGGTSAASTFTINNPAPTLTSISPSSATAGGAGFALTATGTNFVAGSVVRWNGADRTTTYVSGTQLTATISGADIASAGAASVTVFTPTPGGGTSSAQTFTIAAPNPSPTLSSISPTSATAGGAAFTLTVSGTNFINSSVVRWNGGDRTTTFVSATQLQAAISASDIATQGTASVTVFNPAPGGGTSNTRTFTISGSPVTGAVSYVYDRLGRLGAVVDHDGNAAIYTYDAVGNLLSIARQGPSAVSIVDTSPGPGTVGSTVTINGVGFSPTPGNNTVTFNGTPAVVTASTPTQITTTVPAGATSGTIVVTTSGGSGSSTIPFTVLSASDALAITGFTPTIGLAGTPVTISGTNFVTAPTTNNRLRFNRTLALPDTVTSTSIATTVPSGATSGRISIATPAGGSVQSSDDFFLPPSGVALSDVAATARASIGGSSVTFSIPSSKAALLVVDGTAGQQLTLGYSSISPSLTNLNIWLYRPEGDLLSSQPLGFFGGDTQIASLPVTGTYQVLLQPQASYFGNITVTASQDLSVGPLVVGGSSVTANITRPGQRARTTFTGTAGQWLSLHSTSSASVQLATTITNPDGSTLFSGNVVATDGTANFGPLPATGTYTVVLDPELANTLSFDLLLSEALSGAVSVGGAPLSITIGRAGQRARFNFDGTAGQRISIGLTSSTLSSGTLSVLKPDGSTLSGPSGISTSAGAIDLPPLPTTGTYVIQIDPSSNNTGGLTLTLSEEVTGSITTDGSPVTVSINRSGQRARLTFAGTANQRVSLKTDSVTIVQSLVSILKPDGTTQAAMGVFGNSTQFLEPTTLATSGTYAVLIDPSAANTGSITVMLYDVPANPTGSVSVNGGSFTVNLTAPGQTGDVSFAGTSGESITIHGANSTMSGCMTVVLFHPNGGTTAWSGICTTGFGLGIALSSTGTHVIRVDPDTWNTGSVDISVTDP